MKSKIIIYICLISHFLVAQEFEFIDKVYDDQIYTPTLFINGLPISFPILDLNENAKLRLSFDDFSSEEMEYYYTVIHCNADWEKSDIEPIEYLNSFEEGEIRDYYYSEATDQSYIHYSLLLPNSEINWKVSGNYLLLVYYYDEEDNKVVILTKRFMVSENEYKISATFGYPFNTEQLRTHHEFKTVINVKDNIIKSPISQLQLQIYQNGDWNRGLNEIKFTKFLDDKCFFDFPGNITFPAGKEFRHADLRNFKGMTSDIALLDRDEKGFIALLHPDAPRKYKPFFSDFDINGHFIIENSGAILNKQTIGTYRYVGGGDSTEVVPDFQTNYVLFDSLCLKCDYARVLFTLSTQEPLEEDVYVYGALSNWQLEPRFKMEYHEEYKSYMVEVLLKQGYYNYTYVTMNDDVIDLSSIEGNDHETENDYLILVYDRHPFLLYDRLKSVRVINSTRRVH